MEEVSSMMVVSMLTDSLSSVDLSDFDYDDSHNHLRIPKTPKRSRVSSNAMRSTPIKQRLKSLNLNSDTSFSSKIPTRSLLVTNTLQNSEKTSTKANCSSLKPSISTSKLPVLSKTKIPALCSSSYLSNFLNEKSNSEMTSSHVEDLNINSLQTNHLPLKQSDNNPKSLTKTKLPTPSKSKLRFSYYTSNNNAMGKENYASTVSSQEKKRRHRSMDVNSKISSSCKPLPSSIQKIKDRRLSMINNSIHTTFLYALPVSKNLSQLPETSLPHSENKKEIVPSSNEDILKLLLRFSRTKHLFNSYLECVNHKRNSCENLCFSFEDLSSKRPFLYDNLNIFEKSEIIKMREIYFTGLIKEDKLKIQPRNFKNNHGFDDKEKNYRALKGDHINYRYEILQMLGKGAFGSVLSVRDHKNNNIYALKIVKNEPDWSLQAVNEVKYLRLLTKAPNVLNYVTHFHFRSHICIVTELLSVSLYDLVQATKFKGMSISLVKSFISDILKGLQHVHLSGIIHGDLKPENVMLSYFPTTQTFTAKIIDFGSSCTTNDLKFSYLQSRFYRSPEVLLGARYTNKVDIWSVGIIAVELFAGVPIFQPNDEYELLNDLVGYFGPPSRHYIISLREELILKGNVGGSTQICTGTLLWKGFDKSGTLNVDSLIEKRNHLKFRSNTKTLKHFLMRYCGDLNSEVVRQIRRFIIFLEMCFVWNKDRRANCDELLHCDFIGQA